MPGPRVIDRITIQVGKFAFTDVVDDNEYSHDPRVEMMNWTLMYNGAWDYPANVRGYSYGASIDFNQKYWALRYAVMAEPEIANGAPIDPHFIKANGHAWEAEGRWWLDEHPGHLRVLFYLNRANMGDYLQALQLNPTAPDVTATRSYRYKYGFGASWDQQLSKDLGIWGRLGWSDGHTETWAFTPVDRTASLGVQLKGTLWRRPGDVVGLAGVLNGLAADHRNYLRAGGLDFNIGDGQLNYGLEEILEFYYSVGVTKNIFVTYDFQEVGNPAYNRDRGPVAINQLRVHIEF
jgi:high affinity Mn2+ porin